MSLFGDFFDFDGDGTSSVFEEFLGLDLLGFFEEDDSGDFDDRSIPSDFQKRKHAI